MGGDRRAVTALWTIALFFALVTAAGLAGIDGIAAGGVEQPAAGSLWDQGVAWLDTATALETWDYLAGSVLLIAGLLLLVLAATRPTGFALLYIGLVQLLCYGAAELSASWFGRVRPVEALSGGDVWFGGGNSFPSVHAAFYAGLFLPLILLFPRLTPVWAAPPLFVAAALMMQQQHRLSDVGASFALAAALAALLAFIGERARA
ncbi:MAG TPA: phosphatase PAP2 family protein [Allosphingosinicella sp.]|jgi:membrane-associated phospholipid phosphatase